MNIRFIIPSILCVNLISSFAMPAIPKQPAIQNSPQALSSTEQAEYDKLKRQVFEDIDAKGMYGKDPKIVDAYFIQCLRKIGTPIALRLLDDQTRAEEYAKEGIQLLKDKKFAEAINKFSSVIALDPETVAAWYLRGEAYFELNNTDQAINDFTKAISLSNWLPALDRDFTLGYFYVSRALAYFKAGDKKDGLGDLARAANMGNHEAQKLISGKLVIKGYKGSIYY
jgi:tetratricopeptide (TPR) repeat protein